MRKVGSKGRRKEREKDGKRWEINKGWARGGGRKRGRGRGRSGEEE